jgi:hypothetical protein
MLEDALSTAVVTGPLEQVAEMALALKEAGVEVLAAQPDVRQIPGGIAGVGCYVQLPNGPAALLSRFDAAAHVAPMLATRATVVLVADPPDVTPAPDMRLVRLLIEAIIADHGGDEVRVTVIDGRSDWRDALASFLDG